MVKKTNSERMAVIETEITNVKESINDHITEQRLDFKKVNDKLDIMVNIYAGKWVEKVIIFIITVGLVSTIGWILFLLNTG